MMAKNHQDFYAQEKAECPICDGSGWINVTSDPKYPTDKPCRCTLRYRFRLKVGAEVYESEKIAFSPLEMKLGANCYIQSDPREFRPHLRRALLKAGLNFFHRSSTDQDLLDAWLSKERAVTKATQTDTIDFSSLRDLAEAPDLLIIHLGVKTHSNRAMANVIQEAINIRMFQGKPTWLRTPFHAGLENKDTVYYSPNLVDFVYEHFEQFTFKPTTSYAPLSSGLVEDGGQEAADAATDDFFGR